MTRYFDEANGVLIRGLPNVQTTVQGREIFTAEGRLVAIPDFPAQALSPVESYKATASDNLEEGIAGLIYVGLRRPFYSKGFELAGAARGVYNTEFRKLNSIRCQGFQDNVPAAQQILPASVGCDFTFPQHIRLFYGRGTRQPLSVNGPSKQSGRNDTDTAPTTSRADHRAPIANGPTFSLRSRPNMAGSPTRSRVSAKRLESLRLERRWACRRSACPRCYGVIARASDRQRIGGEQGCARVCRSRGGRSGRPADSRADDALRLSVVMHTSHAGGRRHHLCSRRPT